MVVVTVMVVAVATMVVMAALEVAPLAMPMGVAPTAIKAAAMPAIAFAAIPGEVHALPAIPEMPAAAIPEIGLAIVPAIIMRTAHGDAVEHDGAVVNRIAAIAAIIVIIGVARTGRVIAGAIVISGRGGTPTPTPIWTPGMPTPTCTWAFAGAAA